MEQGADGSEKWAGPGAHFLSLISSAWMTMLSMWAWLCQGVVQVLFLGDLFKSIGTSRVGADMHACHRAIDINSEGRTSCHMHTQPRVGQDRVTVSPTRGDEVCCTLQWTSTQSAKTEVAKMSTREQTSVTRGAHGTACTRRGMRQRMNGQVSHARRAHDLVMNAAGRRYFALSASCHKACTCRI